MYQVFGQLKSIYRQLRAVVSRTWLLPRDQKMQKRGKEAHLAEEEEMQIVKKTKHVHSADLYVLPCENWLVVLDYVIDETYPYFSVEWKRVCKQWFTLFRMIINDRIRMLRGDEASLLRRVGATISRSVVFGFSVEFARSLNGKGGWIPAKKIECERVGSVTCNCNFARSMMPCRHKSPTAIWHEFSVSGIGTHTIGSKVYRRGTTVRVDSQEELDDFFRNVFLLKANDYTFDLSAYDTATQVLLDIGDCDMQKYEISRKDLLRNAKKESYIGNLCF